MQTTFAIFALAALASSVVAEDSVTSYAGTFEITVVDAPVTKRDSTCGQPGYLTLTLTNGVLTDALGRTGYIASNYQFQFDGPPQGNALSTSGYSIFSNGSLALDGSAVFYKCLSGTFYNLYSENWAPQCAPILIDILPCGGANAVGQNSDGQPTGTSVSPAPVTQITDGQVQATTGIPVSEFTDGQPQVVTYVPAPVTQITDGQVQAPTSTVQPATSTSTAAAVTQISDGQVQAPTATSAPVPAPTVTSAPAPAETTTAAPVTQISDGQPQVGTSTVAAPSAPSNPGGIYLNATSTFATSPIFSATSTPTPVAANGASGLTVASTFAAAVFGLVATFLL